MSIVELKNVSVIYESIAALKDIDLAVEEGEWLAIMGPSGSGKTTMMNVIGCLDRATSGTTIFDGEDISKASLRALTTIRREKIGLIFQQFHLVPYLTALQNVMLAQYYHSVADKEEAQIALDRVGLGDRGAHLPKELSGGERQRVCIARALINYPKLILADEPTGNLDEANEKIVVDIFEKLNAEGSSIIVVTHDREVAARAERIVRLQHGKIVDRGHSRRRERSGASHTRRVN
ncbi:MAG: ABC transporter ATP-binding protein [Helicobacteraceae bacterium]|jgi:putative ABC transport system ATP-binding protein|nr:ABC transporter ATP-binding protein [Helicobacteraceae bacterium]